MTTEDEQNYSLGDRVEVNYDHEDKDVSVSRLGEGTVADREQTCCGS